MRNSENVSLKLSVERLIDTIRKVEYAKYYISQSESECKMLFKDGSLYIDARTRGLSGDRIFRTLNLVLMYYDRGYNTVAMTTVMRPSKKNIFYTGINTYDIKA